MTGAGEEKNLRIDILSAEKLRNADSGLFGDVSDPFCKVLVSGQTRNKKLTYRTKVIKNNLNPVWNEHVVFSLVNPESRVLLFNLYDKDTGKWSNNLGICGVSLGTISFKKDEPVDLSLNVYFHSEQKGKLNIRLTALDFDHEGSGGTDLAQVDMSYHTLGKSRSLKSILSNQITLKEDKILDEIFGWSHVDEIYDQLDTGDLVLKSGVGTFSMAIMLALGCMYSHAAIIIKNPSEAVREAYGVPPTTAGNVFVLEADSELIDRSKVDGGVQLVEFNHWMKEYYLEAGPTDFTCIRKMNAIDKKFRDASRLDSYLLAIKDKTYEKNKFDLVKCIAKLNKSSDNSSLFCSEIVAETLVELGLLPKDVITSNFSPKDFCTLSTHLHTTLLHGAAFGKELRVRYVRPDEVDQSAPSTPTTGEL